MSDFKYQIGQLVQIKSHNELLVIQNNRIRVAGGFNKFMLKEANCIGIINYKNPDGIDSSINGYKINGSNYFWDEEFLNPIWEEYNA